MKVAIVYDCIPHYRAAVMRQLLASSKYEYHLVADERTLYPTVKPWPIEDRTRFSSAPCRRLIGRFWFQRGVVGLACRRDIKAVVFMAYPDFISTWISALLCRLNGKQVFFWTHGWNRRESGPKSWLRIVFYKLATGLLLYGHTGKSLGIQHGFAPERMHVIYNSLDYERQKRLRTDTEPGDPRKLLDGMFACPELPLVVCPARLIPSCQLELLLEAQELLRREGHLFNVLLIGDGPSRGALEEKSRQLQLPVHFYGACYDERLLARLIRSAHLTVSPGKVGLTAMHSLAYGTPVVTHDDWEAQGPEWEAIQPGVTGQFFRRGDVLDLVRVIRKWTTTPPDSASRSACFSVLERFYNAGFQQRAIERALDGLPADDLFWLKEDDTGVPAPETPRADRFSSLALRNAPEPELTRLP